MSTEAELAAQAIEILQENDRGSYSVPMSGLHPFQWNWDSCLAALGQWHFDEARAWTEVETLFAHQWPDGMVPHIVFHEADESYVAGPGVWETGRKVPTSGITQPPVAGFVLRRLWQRSRQKSALEPRLRALLPKVAAWHRWFLENRDPEGTGLVAILHPWESGRDDAIDWDSALAGVPTEGITPGPASEPQNAEADGPLPQGHTERCLSLVEHFRGLGWDHSKLHDASPFRVVDPGLNAILIRSSADLAALAADLGEYALAEENAGFAATGLAALESLWSSSRSQYLAFDRVAGAQIESASVGGLLPVFAGIPKPRAAGVAATIDRLAAATGHVVPSHDPADPRFDARRAWGGPVWLVVNYMIADGLRQAGSEAVAERIMAASLDLVRANGFAEYYDPGNGAPLGTARPTATAAMVLEFLDLRDGD